RCAKSGNRLSIFAYHIGVQVESQNRLFSVFADQMKESLLVLDIDQLFVNARFDMDDHRFCGTTRGYRHDRFLNGVELTGSVQRNDDINWRDLRQTSVEGIRYSARCN